MAEENALTVLDVRITLDADGDIHNIEMDHVSGPVEAALVLQCAATHLLEQILFADEETQH